MSSSGSGGSQPSRWQVWRREPSNWIALLTLLAVLVYTGVQIEQTSLIRSNNIVSQRAFVYLGSTFTPLAAIAAETRAPIIQIFLPLINGGNTPTKNLHMFYRCAPSVDALPEPWVLLYREPPEKVPDVLGPKVSSIIGCSFTVAQLTDMQQGKLHGYFLAEIFYEDVLEPGNVHKTQYSHEMINVHVSYVTTPNAPSPATASNTPNAPSPPTATNTPNAPNTPSISNTAQLFAALVPRGQHNCTDDDCPK
jgi:hypothetical protein